ncbi:MAG: DUF2911 domain-containing protein [Chitinophagaceae bacterium]|jgi:hypothetical protein|nr:DUF2911 domain-containing protein [Chitinophagaceae bacterium]
MKYLLLLAAICFFNVVIAQDKANRPSPPVTVTQTLKNGAIVTINYGQPSVKGRTIGKDLEPMEGKIWRTGANEATTFEVDRDVEIEDQKLPAGKYALFTMKNGEDWTIIFNKTWNQWGAYNYKEADDALRVKVENEDTKEFAEKLSFMIEKDGEVKLMWGNHLVEFEIE